MNTGNFGKLVGTLAIALLAQSVPAADMYKWQDADGNIHYGQTKPSDNGSVEKVLYYDEAEDLARMRRQVELERAKLEARFAQEQNVPPASVAIARPASAPAEIDYRERQKLQQIERDIERLSSSSIGTVRDRQMQVDALSRQRDAIYSRNGAQPGPTVILRDRPEPEFYPAAPAYVPVIPQSQSYQAQPPTELPQPQPPEPGKQQPGRAMTQHIQTR